MTIAKGMSVEHPDFGDGIVKEVLGSEVLVTFWGEDIGVKVEELVLNQQTIVPSVPEPSYNGDNKLGFRRAYEAVNLGVVPPDPETLAEMSIGGRETTRQIHSWLKDAGVRGLSKVVFGYYGTGKSHFLQLVRAVSLTAGWAVAFLEFDPKAADPAKPHLVYRGLMSNLVFPSRDDGSNAKGLTGLIEEVRRNWDLVRDCSYFKRSPWFYNALEALRYYPHSDDQDYVAGCEWLGGQAVNLSVIRSLARGAGRRPMDIPLMPRVRDTAEIYVFHLVVVNELCRALGYKGLVIILDEAEHVRGYNVRRKERANNFFDILARTAHASATFEDFPSLNEFGHQLPRYWEKGPHFSLFAGLTEGDTFRDPTLSLRDACVFLHSEEDRIRLEPPSPAEYESWCNSFFKKFNVLYPEKTEMLAKKSSRERIALVLREAFEALPADERILRTWVKLASLVPSILMSRNADSLERLIDTISKSAREASGDYLPWEH